MPTNRESLEWLRLKEATEYQNFGREVKEVLKSSQGWVTSLTCINANASSRYLQLFDATSTPNGGEEPDEVFLIPTGSQIVIGTDYFKDIGRSFSTGIVFAFSTTANTYTAGSATDQTTIIKYK